MNRRDVYANSILWSAAIIASAILHAPMFLTLVLLPTLASSSLLLARRQARTRDCAS
jgi:hypothetical protein